MQLGRCTVTVSNAFRNQRYWTRITSRTAASSDVNWFLQHILCEHFSNTEFCESVSTWFSAASSERAKCLSYKKYSLKSVRHHFHNKSTTNSASITVWDQAGLHASKTCIPLSWLSAHRNQASYRYLASCYVSLDQLGVSVEQNSRDSLSEITPRNASEGTTNQGWPKKPHNPSEKGMFSAHTDRFSYFDLR